MDTKEPQLSDVDFSANIENLEVLLQHTQFTQVISDAANKDLVLFVGITGAGKSTCISYLLGGKLDKVRMPGGKKCAALSPTQVIQQKFPEIGVNTYRSCTLYSEVFTDTLSEIAYCDTAGFVDTRSGAEQICASISTQLAVQSAKNVKALVIVIEWSIFEGRTTADLKTLMFTLAQVLNGPYEAIAESLFFFD